MSFFFSCTAYVWNYYKLFIARINNAQNTVHKKSLWWFLNIFMILWSLTVCSRKKHFILTVKCQSFEQTELQMIDTNKQRGPAHRAEMSVKTKAYERSCTVAYLRQSHEGVSVFIPADNNRQLLSLPRHRTPEYQTCRCQSSPSWCWREHPECPAGTGMTRCTVCYGRPTINHCNKTYMKSLSLSLLYRIESNWWQFQHPAGEIKLRNCICHVKKEQ